jgi:thiamine-monophosphate kinase
MISEFAFINRIRSLAGKRTVPDLILGAGDDAAILHEQSGRETLVTADLLVEEIDFKIEYAPPRWLGYKALAVSLSDIAAMGGRPRFSLLTLAIPTVNPQSEAFFEEFFAGYFELAGRHEVTLIGGDISSAPDRLTIDSIAIGHARTGCSVRRSGALIGDDIYLTGSIGASAAGLKMLLEGARVKESEESSVQLALRAHLRPQPRVAFGHQLGEHGLAHSMIDLSDGLAQDLRHICEESHVAAIVDGELVPIADEVSLITTDPDRAFEFAMGGGEDFELLMTASTKSAEALMRVADSCQLKITRIGEIIEQSDHTNRVLVRRNGDVKPLLVTGYDHFRV